MVCSLIQPHRVLAIMKDAVENWFLVDSCHRVLDVFLLIFWYVTFKILVEIQFCLLWGHRIQSVIVVQESISLSAVEIFFIRSFWDFWVNHKENWSEGDSCKDNCNIDHPLTVCIWGVELLIKNAIFIIRLSSSGNFEGHAEYRKRVNDHCKRKHICVKLCNGRAYNFWNLVSSKQNIFFSPISV